ncbi:MAG: hypothetical protein QXT86_13740 [Archaeoglobaceae archaeon]
MDLEKIIRKSGINSRRKGKTFEYQCKKLISDYLEIPYDYLETPFDRKGQALGDVIISGKYFHRLPLFVDFKKREVYELKSLYSNFDKSSVFNDYLKSRDRIRKEEWDNFCLIWSKNYYPIFILGLKETLLSLIDVDNSQDFMVLLEELKGYSFYYSLKEKKWFFMCPFDTFLFLRRKKLQKEGIL